MLICDMFLVKYKKRVEKIVMDYYLATHTYHSDEKKKEFLKRIKGRTNEMWVERMNDPQNSFHERARVVQIFMGKADFFFCHPHPRLVMLPGSCLLASFPASLLAPFG